MVRERHMRKLLDVNGLHDIEIVFASNDKNKKTFNKHVGLRWANDHGEMVFISAHSKTFGDAFWKALDKMQVTVENASIAVNDGFNKDITPDSAWQLLKRLRRYTITN